MTLVKNMAQKAMETTAVAKAEAAKGDQQTIRNRLVNKPPTTRRVSSVAGKFFAHFASFARRSRQNNSRRKFFIPLNKKPPEFFRAA
jgi:hypothetical protein